MKRTLLIVCLFCSAIAFAQVTAGQVDDFSDSSIEGWFEGGGSPNPPMNVVSGGPGGVDDSYCTNDSSGGGGPGSRMAMRNTTTWSGNFTTENIVAIRFDARSLTEDLNIRISMYGGLTGTEGTISSSTSATLTAGAGWQTFEIPISATDMVAVDDAPGFTFGNIAETLANCLEFRIVSNPSPGYTGERIAATLEIDNIEAATSLSTQDFENQNTEFTISPNPGTNKLNIKLPEANSDTKLEVFDVLGKRVYKGTISQLESSIDVSKWRSGIYLVRVSNDMTTQTKRFIKQ